MKTLSVRVSCDLSLDISEETFNQYKEGKITSEDISHMFQTFFEGQSETSPSNTSCEVNYVSEITEQVEEQLG